MFNNIPEDDFYQYADNLDPDAQGHVIKKRLAQLRGEQDASTRVTHTDTVSTAASSILEEDNCTHCHATYGHKISCPTINREAAEELSRIDKFFLKSLRIATDN